MSLIWRVTLLASVSALRVISAESGFALVLPTVPGALFSRGGVIQIPIGAVRGLEFRAGPVVSKYVPDGSVHIRVNGEVADPVAIHQDGLALIVRDENNNDLFSATKPNKISLTVSRMPELNREWTVLRAEVLYATETVGSEDGLPLELLFENNPFPLAAAKGKVLSLTLQGKINRGSAASVTAAGGRLSVTPVDSLTSAFRGGVEINRDADMLVIEAKAKSATCRIFAPVERF